MDQKIRQREHSYSSCEDAPSLKVRIQDRIDTIKAQLAGDAADAGSKAFYTALREFRAKWPQCFISAWTPDDFDCEWADTEKSARIVFALGEDFSSHVGVNWGTIEKAKAKCQT